MKVFINYDTGKVGIVLNPTITCSLNPEPPPEFTAAVLLSCFI